MTCLFRNLLALLLLVPNALPADTPDAVVTFNEIQYNPPGSQDGEWLELHNQMAVNVDLSRWSLAEGISYSFPKGTVIPAGGFIVVAKNPAHPSLTGLSGVLGPFAGNLSNSGETIDLLSPTLRLMDRIAYGDDGDWPVAADGYGATLAKRSGGLASEPFNNWQASTTLGGTPGAPNQLSPGQPAQHPLVTAATQWRFADDGNPPPAAWALTSFDDSAWSQGPGPLGEGFDTMQLTVTATLGARYRAGDISGVANGATFPVWQDSHTADGAAQNATADGDPRFRTNQTATGGPVVRFDGNDHFRTALSPGIAAGSGFVYFVVCRANTAPVSGQLNDGSGAYLFDREHVPTGEPLVSLKAVDGRYGFQRRNDAGNEIGGVVSITPISTSRFQIVAIRRNRTAARYEIWVDGMMEAVTPDSGAPLTPQPIVIGRHATAGSGGFDGDIAELLIYQDELSDADFGNAGAYLAARYGVDTAFPATTPATELAATPTRYLRSTFAFDGNPGNTSLLLEHVIADGAVLYLNGEEITRHNLSDGPVSHDTRAIRDVSTPISSGKFQVSADALRRGTNVLAVSLHSAPPDTRAFFNATLDAVESPEDPATRGTLQLHEISSASAASPFIEIHNPGAEAVMLADWAITHHGLTSSSFALPAVHLEPGGYLSYGSEELGFRPLSGDRVALRSPAGHPVDARTVTNRLRGRSERHPDLWLFPASPSPGAPNPFEFTDDIVIHEICYHPPNLPAIPGIPPTTAVVPLLSFNSVWRYNATGADPGAAWAAVAHPVGRGWQEGPGIHAYSPNNLPVTTGTLLPDPRSNNPYVFSYYFEREFTLTADQAAGITALQWTQVIDDGAVYHLNGVEIHRYQMPAGVITASTPASATVSTATITGPFTIALPPGLAVPGENRLSVQVHQVGANSSDIAFGMNLSAIVVTDPGTPSIPARRSETQWLELVNRGDHPVDLGGWNFSAGISYLIPPGTVMQPGGHLVIASDPAAHAGYPAIGPFEGNLSRSGETLILRDAFNNPANIVPYIDGGRWPGAADGDGSTLELRDPWADNALPESWAASDESDRHQWQTFRYRGVAANSAVGPDSQWREFVLGMLNSGEMLLDDISVIEDPDGAAVPMISGGDFESGGSAWRFLGNHSGSSIVQDPDNPSNKVLHLRATGATEHMHNQVQTTLAAGRSIVNGRTYDITFRARWLRGSNLLNTRLYFNRLARTHQLSRPLEIGTPGGPNSTAVENLGPGYTLLEHDPVVPAPGQPVTIRTRVTDPNGIGALTLRYSVNGGTTATALMTASGSDGLHTATIPGQAAAAIVRFHISANDGAVPPARSWIPAGGPSSRALYQVNDGLAATNGLHNLRIIMEPADREQLYRITNRMSNGRIACTVIYNEREVYYNAGVRLKGSQRGRPQDARVGFNLGFNKDQMFRGAHRTVAIDRSEGQITGCQEILYDHMMNSTGAVPAEYNDLVRVIAPDPAHTSAAILQLARYTNTFLESQFENGSAGTVYEYELIYYPTTADASGLKLPQPDSVVGTDIRDLGDDKENYRWNFLTKNNEDADDYSRVIAMSKRFSLSGAAFANGLDQVIDVDQWLGALAQSCASGAGDSFFSNANHNGQFYARPSDGRMLYLPHDMDFAFSATRSIFENQELQKLIAVAANRRAYLGYLHHICTTVFNQSGMAPWTSHYGGLLPGENFAGHLSYINTRSNHILSSINTTVAPVSFAITTNGGADFDSAASPATLDGTGWVDVREIRLAGSTTALPVRWTSANTWQVQVPLGAGVNAISLEAWNLDGQIVGADRITITNTGGIQQPGPQTLVVSEIHYNPPGSQLGEYLELMNISETVTLDLSGVSFTEGITFTFPPGLMLPPLGRIILAKDPVIFAATFGHLPNVVGGYPDNLSNSGEPLTLSLAGGSVIRSFAYSDQPPWPTEPDGDGHSLTLVNPLANPNHSDPESWRASRVTGGSPGTSDEIDYAQWKLANGNHDDDEDRDCDGLTTRVEYFVGGDPNVAEPHLRPQVTVEPDGSVRLVVHRVAGSSGAVGPSASTDLATWSRPPGTVFLGSTRLPGIPARDRLAFRIPAPVPANRFFVRTVFGP